MKKIDLGQTIQILANVGVIAGIVFLATEVRQNQASLEEANRLNERMIQDTAVDRLMSFSSLIASNEQLADIWIRGLGDEDLSQTEELRFGQLCQMEIWQTGVEASNYQAEGIEPSFRRLVDFIRERVASSTRYKRCWDYNRRIASHGVVYES